MSPNKFILKIYYITNLMVYFVSRMLLYFFLYNFSQSKFILFDLSKKENCILTQGQI